MQLLSVFRLSFLNRVSGFDIFTSILFKKGFNYGISLASEDELEVLEDDVLLVVVHDRVSKTVTFHV